MRTNVPIELTDSERDLLASWIDGKQNKRLATRADVNELVTGFVDGLIEAAKDTSSANAVAQVFNKGNTGIKARVRPAASDPLRGHTHEALIERNIKQRNMSPAQAKGYRRGWTMQPFKR